MKPREEYSGDFNIFIVHLTTKYYITMKVALRELYGLMLQCNHANFSTLFQLGFETIKYNITKQKKKQFEKTGKYKGLIQKQVRKIISFIWHRERGKINM